MRLERYARSNRREGNSELSMCIRLWENLLTEETFLPPHRSLLVVGHCSVCSYQYMGVNEAVTRLESGGLNKPSYHIMRGDIFLFIYF